jgi:hypothetical protein
MLRRLAEVDAKVALEFCSIWNKKLRAAVDLGFGRRDAALINRR